MLCVYQAGCGVNRRGELHPDIAQLPSVSCRQPELHRDGPCPPSPAGSTQLGPEWSRPRGRLSGPSQPVSLSLTAHPMGSREERTFEHHSGSVVFDGLVLMSVLCQTLRVET